MKFGSIGLGILLLIAIIWWILSRWVCPKPPICSHCEQSDHMEPDPMGNWVCYGPGCQGYHHSWQFVWEYEGKGRSYDRPLLRLPGDYV